MFFYFSNKGPSYLAAYLDVGYIQLFLLTAKLFLYLEFEHWLQMVKRKTTEMTLAHFFDIRPQRVIQTNTDNKTSVNKSLFVRTKKDFTILPIACPALYLTIRPPITLVSQSDSLKQIGCL